MEKYEISKSEGRKTKNTGKNQEFAKCPLYLESSLNLHICRLPKVVQFTSFLRKKVIGTQFCFGQEENNTNTHTHTHTHDSIAGRTTNLSS